MSKGATYEELRARLESSASSLGLTVLDFVPAENETPATIVLRLPTEMSKDHAIGLFRQWSTSIWTIIPETEKRWAWVLMVLQEGPPLGFLWGGWKGREDLWTDTDLVGSSDPQEWSRLFQSLSSYLTGIGRNDALGEGDFFLLDDDLGYSEQHLMIHKIEVLTPSVVSDLQSVLKDEFSRWSIRVLLELNPPESDISRRGIVIRADHVEEEWDKERLKVRLGNRFKIE